MKLTTSCHVVEDAFYEKFKVVPYVTLEKVADGLAYCIQKSPHALINTDNAFYVMGTSLKMALAYVDWLIEVPSAIITFERFSEKKEYALTVLQMKINTVKQEGQVENEN